ncbi:MAG: 6-phosphogluconolactonase [Xanthomonadales bacterium]|nr:6-phosphogluconolactonase [Xanthomonadales bacterium]
MAGLVGFHAFDSRLAASHAAANLLASQLEAALAQQPLASLVVSGGSTPGPCFAHLSSKPLDWPKVIVVPSDERWVPAEDPASNEGLIRRQLLQGRAKEAQVLSFFREGMTPDQAPGVIAHDLGQLPVQFSATLLGMGEDGHFASLFPDFSGLAEALDPGGAARCIIVQTGASPHQRISLTLSALLDSAAIVLLIFGQAKRRVFESASKGGRDYPVASLLRHVRCPLNVIWAP